MTLPSPKWLMPHAVAIFFSLSMGFATFLPRILPYVFVGGGVLFNYLKTNHTVILCNGLILLNRIFHFIPADTPKTFSSIALALPILTWLTPVLFPLTAIALFWVDHDAAILGFILSGLIVLFQVILRSQKFLTFLQIFMVVSVFSSPCLSMLSFEHIDALHQTILKSPSHAHRLYIWKVVSDQILQKPWIGYGFKASSSKKFQDYYTKFASITLINEKRERYSIGVTGKDFATYPHHMFLQIWLEFGFFGACFLVFLLCRLLQFLKNLSVENSFKALGMISYYLFYMGISMNPWSGLSLSGLFFILMTLRNFQKPIL